MRIFKLFNLKLVKPRKSSGLRLRLRRSVRVRRVRRRKVSAKSNAHYLKYKAATRALVQEKINFYINLYKEKHKIELKPSGRIAIRNTVSRWGSCSTKGNLNFSYRLSLLPQELSDYIIVHELCHLKEFNHGPKFWDLVGLELPNHEKLREHLKKYSLRTIA